MTGPETAPPTMRHAPRDRRIERLIAASRVGLFGLAIGAILLDPIDPPSANRWVFNILLAYLGLAVVLAAVGFGGGQGRTWHIVTHLADVVVARANHHITYPARFMLVAAMNPCKCGYLADASLGCGRAPKCGREYQSKISGPLFDRIDLHVDVPAVPPADLSLPPARENSAQVAARVAYVRRIQRERYDKLSAGNAIRTNSEADGDLLEKGATPDAPGRQLLTQAAERLKLSARGYHRVLRVARTLADMDSAGGVTRVHVAEALSYRRITLAGG